VIAYKGGGALDTVVPGQTGEYFDTQTVAALAAVMRDFDASRYDPVAIRQHAQRFDTKIFLQQIEAFVQQAYHAHQHNEHFTWRDPVQLNV
jgi:hypothetical protein